VLFYPVYFLGPLKNVNSITVKKEPADLESMILRLCREKPKGITDSLLQSECPGIIKNESTSKIALNGSHCSGSGIFVRA